MEKIVLFWDFHGTLTWPDSLWSKSIHKAALTRFPDCGLKLETVRQLQDNDGFPWHHPENDYRHLTDPSDWWSNISRMMITTLTRTGFTTEQAREILPLIRPLATDPANFRLFAQAPSVLSGLGRAGFRHVLLSNNFPELEQLCGQLGIAQYFDHFVVSALFGFEKPRREIFDFARYLSGNPKTCYMIGDNPVADVDGAVDAGMDAILVNEPFGPKKARNAPLHSCRDLDELRDFLLQKVDKRAQSALESNN